MDPTLEELLLSDPRLLRAFLSTDVRTRLDDEGRAIHERVPTNSLDDIRAAYDALSDRNRLRAAAMDGLLSPEGRVGLQARTAGLLDWLPVTGTAIGAEDTYQSGRAAGAALDRGDYGEAALEGLLALIGAGGTALSMVPVAGPMTGKAMRAMGAR